MGALQSDLQLWIRKFERNWQDYSLKIALRKSFAYLLRYAYEDVIYRLYKIDLLHSQTEPPANMEGVVFRFVAPSDAVSIQQIETNAEWLKGKLKDRLVAGSLCVAAFEGDQLAGFNLVSFGKVFMPLIQLSRRFRKDEAWSEHIATIKAFRKKGLASQLRYRMFEALRRRGIRKFYGGALRENLPSLQLARRVGFREFAEIRYTRLLSRRRWRYARIRYESA